MLKQGQKIIYLKYFAGTQQEIARLDSNQDIPLNYAQYIRHYQPFIEKGHNLSIFILDKNKKITTSSIVDLNRKGNSIFVKTKNSEYEIRYIGIDLARVLNHGKFNGCNKPDNKNPLNISYFPELFS